MKFEWVMIIFVFWPFFGHFVFWRPSWFWIFFGEGHYNLPCKIWSSKLKNWLSDDQFCILVVILYFGGHLGFEFFLWKVNINYHAKSGAPSLKIDSVIINSMFCQPFCFLAAILVLNFFLLKVNINYHAKFGAPSLKIDWVMINFVFRRSFCFLSAILFLKKNYGRSISTSMQNLELLALKLNELELIALPCPKFTTCESVSESEEYTKME